MVISRQVSSLFRVKIFEILNFENKIDMWKKMKHVVKTTKYTQELNINLKAERL